jgi:hypothetical protein
MVDDAKPRWTFLTNHARALICIARDPGARLREIGDSVGITERAAHRIVIELLDAGYIARTRDGRRNHYTVNTDIPLPDALARGHNVGDLLSILAPAHGVPGPAEHDASAVQRRRRGNAKPTGAAGSV